MRRIPFGKISPGDYVYFTTVLFNLYLRIKIFKVSEVHKDDTHNVTILKFDGGGGISLSHYELFQTHTRGGYYSNVDEFLEHYKFCINYVKILISKEDNFKSYTAKLRTLQNLNRINNLTKNALKRRKNIDIQLDIFKQAHEDI